MGVLFSLLLAQALTTPEPSASPLKTITNVTAHPLCTVLRDVMLPFAVVEKQNDDMFKAIDGKFLASLNGAATPPPLSGMAPTGGNHVFFQTPNGEELMAASKVITEVTNASERFDTIEKKLAQSYRDIPVGKDVKLDDLRARMDNVLKLQYALGDSYLVQAAKSLDGANMATSLDAMGSLQEDALPRSVGNPYTQPVPPIIPAISSTTGAQAMDLKALEHAPREFVADVMLAQEHAFLNLRKTPRTLAIQSRSSEPHACHSTLALPVSLTGRP